MAQDDDARKLDELDRLLNDPDVPIDAARVWSLLADLSEREAGSLAERGLRPGADLGAEQDAGLAE
jgi:hypothetical protein